MVYVVRDCGRTAVVKEIKPRCLVAEHNWRMQQFPRESPSFLQQVVEKDEVVAVNGARDPPHMKEALNTAMVLYLHVRRRVTAMAPVPRPPGEPLPPPPGAPFQTAPPPPG